MTLAMEGYGSTIGYSSDGTNYTATVEVVNIAVPEYKGKEIDATHLLSPNGHEEFIPSLMNAGHIRLDLNFTKAQYAAWMSNVRTVLWWKITLSTGSTFVCQGFLTDISFSAPKDNRIDNTVQIKLTGKPTFTQ